VNRSRKLLIAAALLAGGYGLATLLGAPDPRHVPGSSPGVDTLQPDGQDLPAAWTGGAGVIGSVRLLPEPNIQALAGGAGTSAGPAVAAADPPAPIAAAQLASAGPNAAVPASARQASFNRPADEETPALVPVDPPAGEPAAVAVHVVIDGDSLARLAGRYLNDPHRGEEIYRLNRDVLTSPDLLPIGAELKIPVGRSGQGWGERSDTGAGGATLRRGLVPVTPAPQAAVEAPRAQLLRPLPVR
jgi:hypothetical protein